MQTTRALVLRTVRYTDSRIIVSLFTEHYGMISAAVRISRGVNSGRRCALWQILNVVEVNVDYRASVELQKLGDVSIPSPWHELPYHPYKASISMFLGEFLYHSLKNEGENRALFSFLENSLRWLDSAEGGFSNFHLFLMIRMTRFIGILPSMEGSARDKVYDLRGACFSSVLPPHGQYVDANEAALIPVLLEMNYSQMHRLRLSRNERWHMLDVLLKYYRLHMPGFGELQSLDILCEIFS